MLTSSYFSSGLSEKLDFEKYSFYKMVYRHLLFPNSVAIRLVSTETKVNKHNREADRIN